ncbi:MAG: adenylate/guanylate cyclase domain-containing protein [Geminicoccaceae bacterium]
MPEASIAAPRRQLSAILFADVHGYSRLMARNEERTYQRVTQAIRLIRSLIGDYGGQVQHIAGDGILALFDSAARALQFAVAIQREFRNEAVWQADAEPIAFRIGINVGEVLVGAEANVQGHSVNVAARIQALARPGGICITKAVQRAVSDTLGIAMRQLGPQTLKNITEPIEVFAIEVNGPPVPVSAELPPVPSELTQPFTDASVVVLPLANLSDDPRNSHLCDGFTGDVITNLSRFRDLLVIARHSAFLFKNRDVPSDHIAGQLGVRYVMSGGLQRSGSKLRLRVQLTEADTDRVIWSDRYNGDLGDLFAFQDDVTAMIAARLAVQISAAEQRRLLAEQPPELRAYGLILRGQDLSLRFRQESNLHARRLFEHAAEIDPDYGRCYAGMSRTFNLAWRYHWTPKPELALDKAVDLANAAIGYDSLDARGFGELGFACLYKKQHDSSLAAYERAVELNPNDADILAEMGDSLVYSGQAPRAVELLRRAMRLNPYFPDWYLWNLGDAYFHLGDYEQTIETVRKMRDQSEAHRLLAASHALLGHMEEARQHAKLVLKAHPNFSIAHWQNVPPNKNPDDLAVFIEGLRKAGLR